LTDVVCSVAKRAIVLLILLALFFMSLALPLPRKVVVPKQQWMEIVTGDHELPPMLSRLVSDQTTTTKFVTLKKPLSTSYVKLENRWMGWTIVEGSSGTKVISSSFQFM
jgi:hypothetical protein